MPTSSPNFGILLVTFLIAPASWLAIGSSLVVHAQVESAADQKAEADRLFQQADQAYKADDYPLTLQFAQAALILYQDTSIREAWPDASRQGEAETLNLIGRAKLSLGQYTAAIADFEKALSIHRELANPIGEARVLGNLAVTDFYLSQFDQALSHLEQAQSIVQSTDVQATFPQESQKITFTVLGVYANIYYSLEDV